MKYKEKRPRSSLKFSNFFTFFCVFLILEFGWTLTAWEAFDFLFQLQISYQERQIMSHLRLAVFRHNKNVIYFLAALDK
jgi:hypothetical protein